MLGASDIIIMGAVVLVLFGAPAIPKFARSLGQAKAEFEKGLAMGQSGKKRQIAKKKSRNR